MLACCLILVAFMAGTITGYGGLAEQKRLAIGSVPPQELSVRSLIENGPGANRHVTITGFRPGGYASETKSQSKVWSQVWIALFPADMLPEDRREIQVVLSSNSIPGAAPLGHLMQSGRVTGICSDSPRSTWGTVLGPETGEGEQGAAPVVGLEIEEMRQLPDTELVTTLLWCAVGSFVAMILCSLAVFWKA